MRAFLTVSEGESLVIMVGTLEADRHGAAAVTESLHLVHKPKAEGEQHWGGCGPLKLWSSTALTHLFQQCLNLIHPTGNQTYKHTSLWGPFPFNLTHLFCIISFSTLYIQGTIGSLEHRVALEQWHAFLCFFLYVLVTSYLGSGKGWADSSNTVLGLQALVFIQGLSDFCTPPLIVAVVIIIILHLIGLWIFQAWHLLVFLISVYGIIVCPELHH